LENSLRRTTLTDDVVTEYPLLYRVLRPDEDISNLVAKDQEEDRTVISHVNCGSRPYYKSQFISTSASLDKAKRFRAKAIEKDREAQFQIAVIDTRDIQSHTEFVDLTTEENRDHYLGEAVCKNYAKCYEEVLLLSTKPINGTLYVEETIPPMNILESTSDTTNTMVATPGTNEIRSTTHGNDVLNSTAPSKLN